jgi:hypothetical protein
LGGAGPAENQVINVAQKQPWVSDLLLAIREVDEVIHMQEEIVVCGTFKWWGTIPCDSFSKPIVAE